MRLLPVFVILSCSLSCTTTKSALKEQVFFTIELKKDKNAEYLDTNYTEFQISNTRRSNRTLNEYATSFSVTGAEEEKLIAKLKLDPFVINSHKSGE